jgi:uncharacterized membrane protein
MKSKATLLGHPIHPMLIVFPLGLLPVASIFDIIYLSTHNGHWADVSYWLIAAGIIGALIAAVFGFVDWLGIPNGTRAKSIGLIHGVANFIVALLFIVSWFMRRPDPVAPSLLAIVLGWIGIVIAIFAGWLGGELVYRLSMGVDEGANLDAPNSLSGRPATERLSGSMRVSHAANLVDTNAALTCNSSRPVASHRLKKSFSCVCSFFVAPEP